MSSFYQFETPLTLHADPVNPMHAVTKQYVDNKASNINGSRFVSGVIAVPKLPAFTGDVSSVIGTNELILNNSGVAPGVYNSFTLDGKGRVVSGTFTPVQTTDLSWSQVQNAPTTLAGYGITDVISRDVGDTVSSVTMTAVQGGETDAVLTKASVDTMMAQSTLSTVLTGEVVRRPSSTTPQGYLRTNGGLLDKTTYAALYAAIGDAFGDGGGGFVGQPWSQQYAFNTTQSADITGWSVASGNALPAAITYSTAIITKNRVYMVGGFIYNPSGSSFADTVYTAPINSNGTLGPWATDTGFPVPIAHSRAIITKNRVYLLGGFANGSDYVNIYSASINADGTLGAWSIGSQLPNAISEPSVIITKNRVYAIGGYVNGQTKATVYTAPLNSDGTLGAWTTSTDLPTTLASSQCVVTKNRVYLLGGYVGSTGYVATTYTAPINADGTLGNWSQGASLPIVLSHAQAVVTKNRVYLLGGNTVGGSTKLVYTAPVNADGTLGTWTQGTSLSVETTYSQAIVTNSAIYMLGGYSQSTGGNFTTVYTAPFAGGTNDYMALIAANPENTTQFKLPDLTSKEGSGLYYFIKY